jgi:amidase
MFLTFIVTLVGCPALSLPCGLTQEGLPVGLQLVGRPHGDGELLGVALLLEKALGFAHLVPLEIQVPS